jgi:hypothetical protein
MHQLALRIVPAAERDVSMTNGIGQKRQREAYND